MKLLCADGCHEVWPETCSSKLRPAGRTRNWKLDFLLLRCEASAACCVNEDCVANCSVLLLEIVVGGSPTQARDRPMEGCCCFQGFTDV